MTEVLVSLVVLGMAGLGLFHIASTSITGAVKGRDQIAAAQLASEKLEELKNLPFDALASGADPGPISAGGESSGIYSRSWTVTDRSIGSVPAKDVSVTVSWTGGGSMTLATTVVQPTMLYAGYMRGFPAVVVKGWEQER